MKASRIGTICLFALLVMTGFQNCAENPAAAPGVTTDRNTLESMNSERAQLDDEVSRVLGLIAADLTCAVDSDCEELVVMGACENAVASSRRRADRASILNSISQLRNDWRAFSVRAEVHPELAWVCPQGRAVTTPSCTTAGRCELRAN